MPKNLINLIMHDNDMTCPLLPDTASALAGNFIQIVVWSLLRRKHGKNFPENFTQYIHININGFQPFKVSNFTVLL